MYRKVIHRQIVDNLWMDVDNSLIVFIILLITALPVYNVDNYAILYTFPVDNFVE